METTTQTGTITWFEIAKGELPPLIEGQSHSEPILIVREGALACVGLYWHAKTGFFRHNTGNWQPTHWAFINYPNP